VIFGMARRYWIQWMLLSLALLSLGALIGYARNVEYDLIDGLERDRLQVQARVVDENLGRQLEGVSRAMAWVRDNFAPQGRHRMAPEASRHLKLLANSIPGVRTVGIFDASGTTLVSSRDELVGRDFSEREFFRIVKANPDSDTLYVSPPFNTALGAFSINVTRAVLGVNGELAGVVTTTLAPEYFSTLLTSVLYAPGMRAALVHGDGKAVLVEPIAKNLAGMDAARAGSLYTQHVSSGQAANVLVGTAFSTGDQRMSAWRTIQPASLHMDRPLMISVNRDVDGILASWRRDTYTQGGLYGAIFLITTLGLFAYQRRKISQDRLEARFEEERNKAQDVVRESERRLARAMDSTSDGLWERDVVSGRAYFSPAYYRMLGYEEKELSSDTESWLDLMHPEDRERVLAINQDCIDRRVESFATEFRMRAKDGAWRWIFGRGKAVSRDSSGKAVLMIGTHVDITERKHAEMALNVSEERLRLAMDATQQGWFDLNIRTGHVAVSAQFSRIVGATPEGSSTSRQVWIDSIHREDREGVLQAYEECLRTGEARHMEYRMVTRSGAWKWIHSAAKVVGFDAGGLPLRMTGTHADVTERKRQEDLIREHNARLTRQKTELEQMLGRVKRLEGMLSICMQCKKIRAENNAWQQFERYIGEHSDAVFSHGLCPECLAEQMKQLD